MSDFSSVIYIHRSPKSHYRLLVNGDSQSLALIENYKRGIVYNRIRKIRNTSHEVALSNFGGFRDYHSDLTTLVALRELASEGKIEIRVTEASLFDSKVLSLKRITLKRLALMCYVESRWLLNVIFKIFTITFLKYLFLLPIRLRRNYLRKSDKLKITYASRWNNGNREDKLGFTRHDNIGLFLFGDGSMQIPGFRQFSLLMRLVLINNWRVLDRLIMPWYPFDKWESFQFKVNEVFTIKLNKFFAANIWEYYQFSLRDGMQMPEKLNEIHFDKFEMPIGKAIAFSSRKIKLKVGYQHSYLGEMVDLDFALLDYWPESYLPNRLVLENLSLKTLLKTNIKVIVPRNVYRLRHLSQVKRTNPNKTILFLGIRDDFKIVQKALNSVSDVIYVKFHPKGSKFSLEGPLNDSRIMEFTGTTIEALSQASLALIGNSGIFQETEYLNIQTIKL